MDEYDRKAARVHGEPRPTTGIVKVSLTDVDLGFGQILWLVLLITASQAIIGGIVLIALIALDVI